MKNSRNNIKNSRPRNQQVVDFYQQLGKLLTEQETRSLVQQLYKDYKINLDVGFKTPSFKYFKLIRSEDLENIKRFPHLISISYGINPIWLLYLTKTRDQKRKAYYLNLVTNQAIEVKYRFSSKLYRGTLFEGEIITFPQEGSRFIIWDLLAAYRHSTQNQPLTQRLSSIRGILDNHYQSDPLIEPLPLVLRPHATIAEMRSFIYEVVQKDNKHQGIVFLPNQKSTKCYFLPLNSNRPMKFPFLPESQKTLENDDLHPYKIKKVPLPHPQKDTQPTKDPTTTKDPKPTDPSNQTNLQEIFLLTPNEQFIDNYRMYQQKGRQLYYLDTLLVNSKERSLELRDIFQHQTGQTIQGVKNLLPFKCEYVPRFRKWRPISLEN